MQNTLIIKTAAAGDVVRTTTLLNVFEGTIYWVTSPQCKALLPLDTPGLNVLTIEEAAHTLKDQHFTRLISLEEDRDCAALASLMKAKQLTGVYLSNEKMSYTDDSAHWFDMSRISKFGLQKANELKAANQLSYQDCIFKMIGEQFNRQPYRIYSNNTVKHTGKIIGIEKRSGHTWPDKRWWGYDKLIERLRQEGKNMKVFEQRDNIGDYLDDIAGCSHIVSGDTLAMHIAMAYNKTCTAIFNCTSPAEIYDYGLLKKVVSPVLNKYFYSTREDKEAIESVSVEEVYSTLPI
jgi:heptosyltransferase-2